VRPGSIFIFGRMDLGSADCRSERRGKIQAICLDFLLKMKKVPGTFELNKGQMIRKMFKDRSGGNRDGLGMYELLKLALTHPFYFSLLLLMLKMHMNTLVKRCLGIH
jgi:hypothetical protein